MNKKWCEYCQLDADLDNDPDHFQTNGKCVNYGQQKHWSRHYVTKPNVPICLTCKLELKTGMNIIRDDSSWKHWCSWDCVSEWEDRAYRQGAFMSKKERENPLDVQDRKWPNKEKWGQ